LSGLSRSIGEVAGAQAPQKGTAQRIEETALDLFYERGFKSTTVREIALACGLTAGALYNHFASKEKLLASIMLRLHEELLRTLEEGLEKVGHDPRDELHALAYRHALFHTNFQKGARVASQEIFSLLEPDRTEVIAERERGRRLVVDVLERGRRTGTFDVDDVMVVANEILTMGIAIANWYRPKGRLSPEQLAELHAKLVLRMVTTESAATAGEKA
jgi:AcrR family transcriptional regulator